jgi:hypothetical protein
MDSLSYSKNSQFLHTARLGYAEQFSQSCQPTILYRIRVKNSGTDSMFEYLLNFKRGLKIPEKSGKFPKILS